MSAEPNSPSCQAHLTGGRLPTPAVTGAALG